MSGKKIWMLTVMSMVFFVGCDEGINDYNSSANFSGMVYNSVTDPTGVRGVQVLIEADPDAEAVYPGPDRWFYTDADGHFDGAIFLGRNDDNSEYVYISDVTITYFYAGTTYSWQGGATVSPGSHFNVPPVYLTYFQSYDPHDGGQ